MKNVKSIIKELYHKVETTTIKKFLKKQLKKVVIIYAKATRVYKKLNIIVKMK